jgi:hypothetical protein
LCATSRAGLLRQEPAREQRAPGQETPEAVQAEHKKTLMQLFQQSAVVVEELVAGEKATELKSDLENLFEHRKKYYTAQA